MKIRRFTFFSLISLIMLISVVYSDNEESENNDKKEKISNLEETINELIDKKKKLENQKKDLESKLDNKFSTWEIINISNSKHDNLEEVSGIWPSTAEDIINFQEDNNVCSIYDLDDVSGIWEWTIENIFDHNDWIISKNFDEDCFWDENKESKEMLEDIVYINTWSKKDLERLTWISWIGEGTVDDIIEYREENQICSFYDLENKEGIWESTIKDIIRNEEVPIRIDYKNECAQEDKEEEEILDDIVYINTWSKKDLERLPWIWSSTAKNIIEYREENQICSFYELDNVDGISDGTIENIITNEEVPVRLDYEDECIQKNNWNQDKKECDEEEEENNNEEDNQDEEECKETKIVEINSANQEELEKIDGIWPSTAQNIIDYDKEFCYLDQLINVENIWDSTLQEIKDYWNVYVSSPKECFEDKDEEENNNDDNKKQDNEECKENKIININSANQEELEKIDGIGSSTAHNIIEYRQDNWIFCKIDNLDNVSWIWQTTVENIFENKNVYLGLSWKCLANENETSDFEILKQNVDNAGYIIEEDLSIRVPRTEKTYKQLYETLQENIKPFWLETLVTKGEVNCTEDICDKNKSQDTQINITKASKDDLTKVSWIWENTAQNIIDYLDTNEICKLKDLENISWIWDTTIKNIRKSWRIYFVPEENCEDPNNESNEFNIIDLNTSKKEKLKQIDWIWKSTANKIIENRPFCSIKEFDQIRWIWDSVISQIKENDQILISLSNKCNVKDTDKSEKDNKDKKSIEIVDINNSKKEKLKQIDWIWESLAENIIKKRNFCNFEELKKVDWVWESIIETMKQKENVFMNLQDNCINKNQCNKKDEQNQEDIQKEKIELNSADKDNLTNIDGIGPSLADNILENQQYCSKKDLLDVSWIWEKTLKDLVSNENIFLDILSCKQENQESKTKINSNIKIKEVNPRNTIYPNYIVLESEGDEYKWDIKIKWWWWWDASLETTIEVGKNEKILITDNKEAFKDFDNIKQVESLYFTNTGQEITLVWQDRQVLDSIIYDESKDWQSLVYSNFEDQEWKRVFNDFDNFLWDYVNPSEIVKNNIDLKEQIKSHEDSYKRARENRSICVEDRDLYEKKYMLHRNYAEIVTNTLKYDWRVVFENSWIKDYYQIYQNSKENISKDSIDFYSVPVKPYNIDDIKNIRNNNFSELPARYDEYQEEYVNERYTQPIVSIIEFSKNKISNYLDDIDFSDKKIDFNKHMVEQN